MMTFLTGLGLKDFERLQHVDIYHRRKTKEIEAR